MLKKRAMVKDLLELKAVQNVGSTSRGGWEEEILWGEEMDLLYVLEDASRKRHCVNASQPHPIITYSTSPTRKGVPGQERHSARNGLAFWSIIETQSRF